jgi:hypothetical protein
MSWDMLDLNGVTDSGPKSSAIEPSTQIVRLLGAKPDNYKPNALAFDLVVDEGTYKNRRIFPTLPDPSKQPWAANAAKHLASVLGVTQEPGESVQAMFNRAAQSGTSRFSIQVTKEDYISKKTGEPGSANNVQFFSAQAVA